MWVRYVLVAVIALLVGALLGGRFLPGAGLRIAQPVVTALEPIPEGVQSWRFVVANPSTGKVTVYEATDKLSVVGSAKY